MRSPSPLLALLLLLLLWGFASAAAAADSSAEVAEGVGECPPRSGTLMSAAVGARRNLTGHWKVTAGVEQPAGAGAAAGAERALRADVSLSRGAGGTLGLYLTATVSEGCDLPPSAGYVAVRGLRWYKPHLRPATWFQAQSTCEREGAHLIVINSEAEAEVVRTLAERSLGTGCDRPERTDHYFVGFNDIAQNRRYVTVLGGSLSETGYSRWARGEPRGTVEEGCGVCSGSAQLRDVPCSWNLCFICEHP